MENDYLRQENKILRSKLGARVPLTETDRFRQLLFIGESIPASTNSANSKRVLRFVLGADEFLHPTPRVRRLLESAKATPPLVSKPAPGTSAAPPQLMRFKKGELSGGEMQRVAIARALPNRPLLLLADGRIGEGG